MEREKGIAPPATISAFTQTIGDLVEREAIAFFGERPTGLLLILDDFETLCDANFRGNSGRSAISCASGGGRPNSDIPQTPAGMASD